MPLVLDASVALSWLFSDEFNTLSQDLLTRTLTEDMLVPSHWWSEIANGALIGERRGRVRSGDIDRWLERIADMQIGYDRIGQIQVFDNVMPLARAHGLTVYDALYLELAQRTGLALATFDKALADAANSVGLTVIA